MENDKMISSCKEEEMRTIHSDGECLEIAVREGSLCRPVLLKVDVLSAPCVCVC